MSAPTYKFLAAPPPNPHPLAPSPATHTPVPIPSLSTVPSHARFRCIVLEGNTLIFYMLQVQFPGDLSGWWGEIRPGRSVYRITLIIPLYINPIITSFASFQAPHYGGHHLFSISAQCGDEDTRNGAEGLVKINVLLPTGLRGGRRGGRVWEE